MNKYFLNRLLAESDNPLDDVLSRVYRLFLIFITISASLLTTVTTNKNISTDMICIIDNIQAILFALISIDFLFRLIENEDKKEYLSSFYGTVDLLSIIPFLIYIFHYDNADLETIFGMIVFLKIARYSPALTILKDVIISERKPLISALYLMMLLTFATSSLLYFIERDVTPGFASVPHAMWWSIVTLATLGYGDVYPLTVLGKIFGGMSAVLGFGMFALPAGILANGFAEEMKRLRDVASWNLVAKVPLFQSLSSEIIASIANLLRIRRFIRNEIIIKEGDKGTAMYFILDGEVEVSNSSWKGVLKRGSFFGEIAILHDVPRTATVKAKTRCELLELTAYDFKRSMASHPNILKEIESVAKERYKVNS